MPLRPEAKYSITAEDRTAAGVASAQARLKRFAVSSGKVLGAIGAVGGGLLLRGVIRETVAMEDAMAQLRAGIQSTGGVAGFTADELAAMADELQGATTFANQAISAMQAQLLTFTNIRGEVFEAAQAAVLDLSTRMGTDLRSSVLQLGKALNDPVLGVTALADAGIQFTVAQKETIKTLVESGQLVAAQTIILKELETQFGGSAEAAKNTFGGALAGLKNAFGDLMQADGLPGAVDDLNELTATLQDPATKKAAQELTGALVRGFGAAATALGKFAVGLQQVFTRDADEQIEHLKRQRESILKLIRAFGETDQLRHRLIDINIELGKAEIAQQKLLGLGEFGPGGRLFDQSAEGARALAGEVDNVTTAVGNLGGAAVKTDEKLQKLLEQARGREQERQPGFVGPAQDPLVGALPEQRSRGVGDPDLGPQPSAEQAAFAAEHQRQLAIARDTADELSNIADQAGRNMLDAFAEFLFDPFEKGLDGMLKGFADVIRQMIAQAAAAQIFGALAHAFPAFGAFFNIGKAATSRAMGGPLAAGELALVGERGPELVRFDRASTVIPNHALGPAVIIHQTIQAGLPPQWQGQLLTASKIAASAAQQAVEKRLGGRR